jgi:hypothetical protein
MKKIEDILTSCIMEIKSGQATLDECLERYPDLRHELEPLLRLALSIRQASEVKPSDNFKIRARVALMEQIHAGRKPGKQSRGGVFGQAWSAAWVRAAAIAVAVVLALSAMSAGTAYASQESLPGDTLYPVKIGSEQVRVFLSADEAARLQLEMDFAETRLNEMKAVADKAPDRLETAVNGYENNLSQAVGEASRGMSPDHLEEVSVTMCNHMAVLDSIEDSSLETLVEIIRQAKGIAISQQAQALRSLAVQDPVRAAEINLNTEQSRLDRALAEAGMGRPADVQESIGHFMQMSRFGNEIAEIAMHHGHNTAAIDELYTLAEASQLEALGIIQEKVSGQAAESVEEAITLVMGHGKMMQDMHKPSGAGPNTTGKNPATANQQPGCQAGQGTNRNHGGRR